MRVIIFGATGMVGQAVLRECLLDARVTAVLLVVRSPVDCDDAKVTQIVHDDFLDFSSMTDTARSNAEYTIA